MKPCAFNTLPWRLEPDRHVLRGGRGPPAEERPAPPGHHLEYGGAAAAGGGRGQERGLVFLCLILCEIVSCRGVQKVYKFSSAVSSRIVINCE